MTRNNPIMALLAVLCVAAAMLGLADGRVLGHTTTTVMVSNGVSSTVGMPMASGSGDTTTTIIVKNGTTSTVMPITSSPATTSHSISCDLEYCSSGYKFCLYNGGITAFDPVQGPKPGEILTQIGPCSLLSSNSTAVTTTAPFVNGTTTTTSLATRSVKTVSLTSGVLTITSLVATTTVLSPAQSYV